MDFRKIETKRLLLEPLKTTDCNQIAEWLNNKKYII